MGGPGMGDAWFAFPGRPGWGEEGSWFWTETQLLQNQLPREGCWFWTQTQPLHAPPYIEFRSRVIRGSRWGLPRSEDIGIRTLNLFVGPIRNVRLFVTGLQSAARGPGPDVDVHGSL
ncbi:unnamed protein product [Merluccius merluccius]